MREIGIVKWFGGYNDYGFIARDSKPDIFVHRRQVRCSESSLLEGTFVTFEVGINPRNGKEEAKNLLLLIEETDLETISHCARSTRWEMLWRDKELWPVLGNYLANVSTNEAVSLVVEKIDIISRGGKVDFVRSLPKKILLSCRAIREVLPTDEHLELCLKVLGADMNTDMNPNLLEEIIATIEAATHRKEELWGKVPSVLYEYENDPDILRRLPPRIHASCLVNLLLNAERPQNRDVLLSELQVCLEKPSESDIWELIPDAILLEDQMWLIAPRNRRIAILAAQLNKEGNLDNEYTIARIANVLYESPREERPSLVSMLPGWVKQHNAIFAFLPPVEQVNLAWTILDKGSWTGWQNLSREAKILFVYRLAKENRNFDNLDELDEKDLLVRCALILLWAKDNPQKSDAAFKKAHTLLQDYVVNQAWSSTEPLDLYPLLPHCRPGVVQYCEGRPWPTEEDKKTSSDRVSHAFCPRAKRSCALLGASYIHYGDWESDLEGARLYAECSQDWKDWSLLELLEATCVVPHLSELPKSDEYVPRLSGWINRLNEIRERLKCSICGQMMTPNFKYAKNLAVYNNTVVSCQRGGGHDQNIYLSHCWACREIIDSRESIIKVEGYYICIHCGSGPQQSDSYTQGDICPKCGTQEMLTSQRGDRIRECRACNHLIRLPAEQYLTGARSKKGRNFI